MKAVSALDVARAALLEVGEDPGDVYELPDLVVPGRIAIRWHGEAARKAVLLARLATSGPDHLVRCNACSEVRVIARFGTVPCTPVREVLRGVTCGRAA